MRLLDVNRLQARRTGWVDGKWCLLLVLHYISGLDTQQGLSPPFPLPLFLPEDTARGIDPGETERRGGPDRRRPGRSPGGTREKILPDEERGFPGNDFLYNTSFNQSSTIPRSGFF